MIAHKRFHEKIRNDNNKKSCLDGVGNKKDLAEIMIPPDDVGNAAADDLNRKTLDDDFGNNIEGDPLHLQSGILAQILGGRALKKSPLKPKSFKKFETQITTKSSYGIKTDEIGENYLYTLRKDFLRLLSLREGKPFSFFMRPAKNHENILDQIFDQKLLRLKNLIMSLLMSKVSHARVEAHKYTTTREHFIVFFVEPAGDDPVVNKYLIAALRQVIDGHVKKHFSFDHINLFVILSSAKSVMEAHLEKLGARKI